MRRRRGGPRPRRGPTHRARGGRTRRGPRPTVPAPRRSAAPTPCAGASTLAYPVPLISAQLDTVPLHQSELAGDYIPYLPAKEELPPDAADAMLNFLAQVPEEERDRGPALAREALAEFTGPVDSDRPRHELVVTHNFLIGWLIRAALDAPEWRWMGLNHGNAALTAIRYAPGRPSSVLFYNDMRHLPAELRWTGFPPELHI
ncbi:histidine phosphatase family protein [Streptomyces sp. NPDC058892]|uniref:histidine phosphatase family protein n=1 Tax=unclassified Streptomyces TaxID=2593676 RepID=UPI0036B3120F